MKKDNLKTLAKSLAKYKTFSNLIKKKNDGIKNLKDQISELKKAREGVRFKMHAECPHCNGNAFTYERDNSYENGRDWVKCRYRLKWLTGEIPVPEKWRMEIRW